MLPSNNTEKFLKLREAYPFFVFEGFDYQYSEKGLRIQYHFNLSDRYSFHPTLIIPAKDFFIREHICDQYLDNLLFQIGMVELISYWKATCSPVVEIKSYCFNQEQIRWWKKLFYKGLGEFRFLNGIEVSETDFLEFRFRGKKEMKPFNLQLEDSVVIPVGGGKDSAVTWELLKTGKHNVPMIINPREASRGTVQKSGRYYDSIIEVQRTIDPALLDLNEQGFLNGHTPFSALLAFVSALSALLSGKKHIALSNESSANENTIRGLEINHQYSKSVEFERDFRHYTASWVSPDINYFSFLRPLNELQISFLFSRFSVYFPVFRSCNVGSKTDSWCRKCAKCLFTFIVLSPFLDLPQLKKIFGKNLWDDPSLETVFNELTGYSEVKPFDCIGTVEEVNVAVTHFLKQNPEAAEYALLKSYITRDVYKAYTESDFTRLLESYDGENFLSPEFEAILKSSLHA
jgi:UDP-N-acetyl-alpha-D-muramoyl-L-alanyl-L-glutamate epimerase